MLLRSVVQTYVGNVAWAHVLAMKKLRESQRHNNDDGSDSSDGGNDGGDGIAGRYFIITDNTPIRNTFEQFVPFLHMHGYKLSTYSIPFHLLYLVVFLLEMVVHVLAPIYKFNLHLNLSSVIYSNQTYYFSRKRIESALGFEPLFTHEQAMSNSIRYYSNLTV